MEKFFFDAQIRFAKEQGGDYSIAYQDGLRKAYHGDSYVTRYHVCEADDRADGFADGIFGKAHRDAPKNLGNQNAIKDDGATSRINLRVTPEQKSLFVKKAHKDGKTLSQWILDKLAS